MKAIKNLDGSLIDYLIKSVVNIKKGIFIRGSVHSLGNRFYFLICLQKGSISQLEVNKIVIPKMNKDYLKRSTISGGNSFHEGAKTINGFTDNAIQLIKLIEILISREDLSNLTLYKLKDIILFRNLLKESFTWCPDCIRNWMNHEKIIYYPLIWYIKSVNICFEHKRYLLEMCPACNKKMDLLRRQMIPG